MLRPLHLINVVFKFTSIICILCINKIVSMSITPSRAIFAQIINYLNIFLSFFSSTVFLIYLNL